MMKKVYFFLASMSALAVVTYSFASKLQAQDISASQISPSVSATSPSAATDQALSGTSAAGNTYKTRQAYTFRPGISTSTRTS